MEPYNKKFMNQKKGTEQEEKNEQFSSYEENYEIVSPVKDLFAAAESEEMQQPTNARWEEFQKEILERISKKQKFLSKEWLSMWKDKLSATDSLALKFTVYLVLALILGFLIAAGYFIYMLIGNEANTQVSSVASAAGVVCRLVLGINA